MTKAEKIQAIIEADVGRMDMYDLANILRDGVVGYNQMTEGLISEMYDNLPG